MLGCRGGYCFEQNNLLAKVLGALGFDLYCTAARVVKWGSAQQVCMPDGEVCMHANNIVHNSPFHTSKHAGIPAWECERLCSTLAHGVYLFCMQIVVNGWDHQVILARVPESPAWHLVDVGFGGPCPTQPVPLQVPETDDFTGSYLYDATSLQVTYALSAAGPSPSVSLALLCWACYRGFFTHTNGGCDLLGCMLFLLGTVVSCIGCACRRQWVMILLCCELNVLQN